MDLRKMAEWIPDAAGFFYPRRCPVCQEAVEQQGSRICGICRTKLSYVRQPFCQKCGKPLLLEEQEYCRDCRRKRHRFERGRAPLVYDRIMKSSIAAFKYGGRREYAAFYAQEICRWLSHEILLMDADAIIPVPIHPSRLRCRGYNQAELVAAELSRLTGIPMYDKLVQRSRKTVPQKELTIQERQNNLKKAFNISTNVVKLNKTILIDDIYTTGSTLDAVALELKRHGVKSVYFIALCIGEGM